jgi:hypothetical protein
MFNVPSSSGLPAITIGYQNKATNYKQIKSKCSRQLKKKGLFSYTNLYLCMLMTTYKLIGYDPNKVVTCTKF